MEKMLNEGNQIHNFMSSSGSVSVINYGSGSGSDFLTSYSSGSGSGSKSQKVTVPTVPVPVPQHWKPVRTTSENIESELADHYHITRTYSPPAYLAD